MMITKVIFLTLGGILIICIGILGYYKYSSLRSDPNSNIIIDPESGQTIIRDELTILTSGQNITTLIKPYKGVITLEVTETQSYQIRFPVSSLADLKRIKNEIGKTGATVYYSIVLENPGLQ